MFTVDKDVSFDVRRFRQQVRPGLEFQLWCQPIDLTSVPSSLIVAVPCLRSSWAQWNWVGRGFRGGNKRGIRKGWSVAPVSDTGSLTADRRRTDGTDSAGRAGSLSLGQTPSGTKKRSKGASLFPPVYQASVLLDDGTRISMDLPVPYWSRRPKQATQNNLSPVFTFR